MYLRETHYGARARWHAIYEGRDTTVVQAWQERQAESKKQMTLQDKRDFYRGWRIGKARYALEDISRHLNYATADELEMLGNELWELARKHGLALSDREQREALGLAQEGNRDDE